MRKGLLLLLLVGVLVYACQPTPSAPAQAPAVDPLAALRDSMAVAAQPAQGRVGAVVHLLGTDQTLLLDSAGRYPMQSVFKLPIAMAVLAAVDSGRLSLDQPVRVTPADFVSPGQRSPIRDAHPKGAVLPLRDYLRNAVSESDGTAADVLWDQVGGASVIMARMRQLGVTDIQIEKNEKDFARDPQNMFRNWITPRGAQQLLTALHQGAGLSDSSLAVLNRYLIETPTGPRRLRALLPPGTVLAHKTGTSGELNGVTVATNDVGIIHLPDGRRLAVAVFVADSPAPDATSEAVIANIAYLAYRHYAGQSRQ